MGKVNTLSHFPLEPGCKDYSFLDQAVEALSMVMILSLWTSMDTPELYGSLDEVDAMHSSVSPSFLCLVSTISDAFRSKLAFSIHSLYLQCQARVFLLPGLQAGKMSACKFIHYFSSHPATFGFCALPSDNITLNHANKRTNHSLSNFQTDIGAAIHATLHTKQCISDIRTAFVDTVASLQGSDGKVIATSKVHDLLTKIHDILDSVICKWVGNTARP